jgi:chromosome segregation ATPase
LHEQGFSVLIEDDTQDPDRPNWRLQRNTLFLRNRELEQQLLFAQKATMEQEKQVAESGAEIVRLTQTRDEQTKFATERQTQIQQLTQTRDEQAKLATELQRQLDEKQKRLHQIESQNAEFTSRQSLLQDEMIRAEAQIDLIKDVLLREPAL